MTVFMFCLFLTPQTEVRDHLGTETLSIWSGCGRSELQEGHTHELCAEFPLNKSCVMRVHWKPTQSHVQRVHPWLLHSQLHQTHQQQQWEWECAIVWSLCAMLFPFTADTQAAIRPNVTVMMVHNTSKSAEYCSYQYASFWLICSLASSIKTVLVLLWISPELSL